MTDRILDFSETGAYLSLQYNQLVIKREGAEKPITAPIDELAAVLLANPAITLTQPLLVALSAANVAVVVCGANHMPAAVLSPLEGHSTQVERLTRQAAAPLPLRKRLWKSIVQSKIRSQARMLETHTGNDAGLRSIAARVRAGDAGNCEAHAARIYWPCLLGDDFRRDPAGQGANRFLNYGYAVLRAITARALCGCGLHPSLGVHHHNRYDAFCLADDLMEPFRPLVDAAVIEIVDRFGPDAEIQRDVKRSLLGALTGTVEIGDETRTLFDALRRTAASLAAVLLGEATQMRLPAWDRHSPKAGKEEDPAPDPQQDCRQLAGGTAEPATPQP